MQRNLIKKRRPRPAGLANPKSDSRQACYGLCNSFAAKDKLPGRRPRLTAPLRRRSTENTIRSRRPSRTLGCQLAATFCRQCLRDGRIALARVVPAVARVRASSLKMRGNKGLRWRGKFGIAPRIRPVLLWVFCGNFSFFRGCNDYFWFAAPLLSDLAIGHGGVRRAGEVPVGRQQSWHSGGSRECL